MSKFVCFGVILIEVLLTSAQYDNYYTSVPCAYQQNPVFQPTPLYQQQYQLVPPCPQYQPVPPCPPDNQPPPPPPPKNNTDPPSPPPADNTETPKSNDDADDDDASHKRTQDSRNEYRLEPSRSSFPGLRLPFTPPKFPTSLNKLAEPLAKTYEGVFTKMGSMADSALGGEIFF